MKIRTIKFRAWDVRNKHMIYQCDMRNHNGSCLNGFPIYELNPKTALLDTHFMQFTTLTDRNKVEIYEGDIVLLPEGNFEVYVDDWVVPQFRMREIGKLERNNRPRNRRIEGWATYSSQVIGNIYEHPELLKCD
ncbi:MAG: YopX protein [Podoviridae sp. ctviO18]|nr:MAG: YopX protein [Podoviridae sp. ctviO18]